MTSNLALLIVRIILVTALIFALSKAHATTCVYKTNDIGTVVGKGKTKNEAFSDAALQCFSRREKLYKIVKNIEHVPEEVTLTLIDICANLRCSK